MVYWSANALSRVPISNCPDNSNRLKSPLDNRARNLRKKRAPSSFALVHPGMRRFNRSSLWNVEFPVLYPVHQGDVEFRVRRAWASPKRKELWSAKH